MDRIDHINGVEKSNPAELLRELLHHFSCHDEHTGFNWLWNDSTLLRDQDPELAAHLRDFIDEYDAGQRS